MHHEMKATYSGRQINKMEGAQVPNLRTCHIKSGWLMLSLLHESIHLLYSKPISVYPPQGLTYVKVNHSLEQTGLAS